MSHQQISLFDRTTLKSAFLVARSKRRAFYNLFLEIIDRQIVVRKESGGGNKIADTRTWLFENYANAEKEFNRIIKRKMDPKRTRRRYKVRIENR